jgi:hypothetical protein
MFLRQWQARLSLLLGFLLLGQLQHGKHGSDLFAY